LPKKVLLVSDSQNPAYSVSSELHSDRQDVRYYSIIIPVQSQISVLRFGFDMLKKNGAKKAVNRSESGLLPYVSLLFCTFIYIFTIRDI